MIKISHSNGCSHQRLRHNTGDSPNSNEEHSTLPLKWANTLGDSGWVSIFTGNPLGTCFWDPCEAGGLALPAMKTDF